MKMKNKRILLLFSILFLTAMPKIQAQPSAIDKYFKQYVEDDRFTVVYVSAKLFRMLGKLDIDGWDIDDREAEAVLDMAQDLRGLRVLVSEYDVYELFQEAKSKIDTEEYEVLLTVRSKDGDNVEFLIKDTEDESVIEELLLLYGGGDEFVMASFVGKIILDKVYRLAREIERH